VQNFAAIGPRSSEITREGGKENKPQQNLSPLPQAITYGRTKKNIWAKTEVRSASYRFRAD